MLRTRPLWLAAALIASSAIATTAHAQQPPAQTQLAPESRGDRMYRRLQQNLALTDDQVNQIRAVNQAQRDTQRQLRQATRQAQQELRQLALTGGDANALAAKKAQVDQLLAQSNTLRVQRLQQIAPILNPDQRQKLADLGPRAMWGGPKGSRGPKTQA